MATITPPVALKSVITPPALMKSTLHRGLPGPRGPAGPSGGAGGATYTYTQATASAVWTVPHNLGRYPSVVVADHLGNVVIADVAYLDENTIRVTHATPLTGVAYCN